MTLKAAPGYLALVLVFLFLVPIGVPPASADGSPTLNNGKRWRIGYYEGGPYSDYTDTMRTLVKGLIEKGWIKDQNPPELYQELPKPYWEWLGRCDSPFLSFRPEDGYSALWDGELRSRIRSEMLKKLKAKELDLVLAMGTWAGLDLANNEHSVPTMVLSTSDPVKAGIIKSAESSGYEHVTARVDPTRYLRQVRMFHRIVGFQNLGIAYENTPDGRVYSALSDVDRIARERGFKVLTCEVIDTTTDTEKSDRTCLDCYRLLAQGSEAVYVTALACVDRRVQRIAQVFKDARVPSFSMIGSKYVKQGIMLSISSDSGYMELGRYNAMKLGAILNGAKPITLQQVFEDPLEIAVNLRTARDIGFEMPKGLLRIATEIYEK